jgi:hypothetical protein
MLLSTVPMLLHRETPKEMTSFIFNKHGESRTKTLSCYANKKNHHAKPHNTRYMAAALIEDLGK